MHTEASLKGKFIVFKQMAMSTEDRTLAAKCVQNDYQPISNLIVVDDI